jgi:hypothetical protein
LEWVECSTPAAWAFVALVMSARKQLHALVGLVEGRMYLKMFMNKTTKGVRINVKITGERVGNAIACPWDVFGVKTGIMLE